VLRRSPIRRKTPLRAKPRHQPTVEREPKPVAKLTRIPNYCGTTSGRAVEKRVPIRSPKLLAAVRRLPCMVTGIEGQTEAAHSNWPQHGKGRSIKADDNRVAALSRDVHRELDQGKRWSAEERQAIWWQAHRQTVQSLLMRGEWPDSVPVPQLEDFWRA
jgi:hypothetical protein